MGIISTFSWMNITYFISLLSFNILSLSGDTRLEPADLNLSFVKYSSELFLSQYHFINTSQLTLRINTCNFEVNPVIFLAIKSYLFTSKSFRSSSWTTNWHLQLLKSFINCLFSMIFAAKIPQPILARSDQHEKNEMLISGSNSVFKIYKFILVHLLEW